MSESNSHGRARGRAGVRGNGGGVEKEMLYVGPQPSVYRRTLRRARSTYRPGSSLRFSL